MRKGWFGLIALLLPVAAVAQQNPGVQQSGPVTSLHLPAWATQGVLQDGGGAAGSSVFGSGYVTELGITNSGLPLCITSALLSSQSGYYQSCMGANATVLGETGAFFTFNAYGGAAQLPLVFEINGANYDFPGNGQGNILGPNTSTINEPMVWANTQGTLAKDGLNTAIAHTGSLSITGATTLTGATGLAPTAATLSSLNSLYFPTYSQLAGVRDILALSGVVSDSAGSFRDTFYAQSSDSDTTTYTQAHTNYAGRFAAFGANTGTWQAIDKNIVGLNAYGYAATTGTGRGVSGINTDAVQYGAGISDNEFAAHNPSSGNGSIAQSVSMAGVQAIIDSNYADNDVSHIAYGINIDNIGSKKITAALSATNGDADYMIYTNAAMAVHSAAITMPHSGTGNAGTIIDYGLNNGNPAGGSYTYWASATDGGTFGWVDAGATLGTLGVSGLTITGKVAVGGTFSVTQASPAAADACTAGQIVADTGFIYTCASTGVWKRVAVTGSY
jgi:hypothetical protein